MIEEQADDCSLVSRTRRLSRSPRVSGLLSELSHDYGLESTPLQNLPSHSALFSHLEHEPLFIVFVSPISRWIHVKIIAKLPVVLEVIPTLERIKLIDVR